MREIKFRVWDKKENEFTISLLQYLPDGSLKAEPSGILMQYTGLKDKNGREIYEGDRVKFSCIDFAAVATIEFKDGAFRESHYGYGLPKSHYMEIIGNIYENPELLNV